MPWLIRTDSEGLAGTTFLCREHAEAKMAEPPEPGLSAWEVERSAVLDRDPYPYECEYLSPSGEDCPRREMHGGAPAPG